MVTADLEHALRVRGRAVQWPASDFRVMRTADMTASDRTIAHELFDVAYDRANHAYLDKSFHALRYIAFAEPGGIAAGFALNDQRELALPRLGVEWVSLGGICCIAPEFCRRGLFGLLESLAGSAAGIAPDGRRRLSCGRMAHPASFRGAAANPSGVPKVGMRPTRWQQEVGLVIAGVYGSTLDPTTFTVVGAGTPIGYPRMEVEATEEEWRAFEHVDRDRGDALLSIAWSPEAPDGWIASRSRGRR